MKHVAHAVAIPTVGGLICLVPFGPWALTALLLMLAFLVAGAVLATFQ